MSKVMAQAGAPPKSKSKTSFSFPFYSIQAISLLDSATQDGYSFFSKSIVQSHSQNYAEHLLLKCTQSLTQ